MLFSFRNVGKNNLSNTFLLINRKLRLALHNVFKFNKIALSIFKILTLTLITDLDFFSVKLMHFSSQSHVLLGDVCQWIYELLFYGILSLKQSKQNLLTSHCFRITHFGISQCHTFMFFPEICQKWPTLHFFLVSLGTLKVCIIFHSKTPTPHDP